MPFITVWSPVIPAHIRHLRKVQLALSLLPNWPNGRVVQLGGE